MLNGNLRKVWRCRKRGNERKGGEECGSVLRQGVGGEECGGVLRQGVGGEECGGRIGDRL